MSVGLSRLLGLGSFWLVLAYPLWFSQASADSVGTSRPNIIVIYCDNLGYADIEPFGSQVHRTPHVNRLAEQGRKFTHFYSASGVCTPSRAALMTGCYPLRVGMAITDGVVLRPVSPIGLNPLEWTIAEQLQQAGYDTAIFGKWHLGDQPEFLPTRQGFDFYEGIPYSDDMTPRPNQNWPPLPYLRQETVLEAPVDRDLLCRRLTQSACDWISARRERPFFLYFPQCMPGSTKAPFASEGFRGKSRNGPWGDSIEEIDWSLGEMLNTLAQHQLTSNTLIIWTSDNGAPRGIPPWGSNAPLAGWGYSVAEGGMRVPCLMQWPSQIPAGTVCEALCTTMDLLPTFAAITGTKLPEDRPLDGHNILPLMTGNEVASPYEAFYYYHLDQLLAVRARQWKLYLPIPAKDNQPPRPARLFDVVADPGETRDLAADYPAVVAELEASTHGIREDLGDQKNPGKQARPHGLQPNPQPLLLKNSP